MRPSKISALLRYSLSWWAYSLLVLLALFLLEIIASMKSIRYIWLEESEEELSNIITGNELPRDELELNPIESTGLVSLRRYRQRYEVWSRWTTRIYITIVLCCAGVGFLSLSLPKPFYFGLILWGVPFAGAYIFARSWRKEED